LAPQSHGVHLTDGLQKPPTCNPVESGTFELVLTNARRVSDARSKQTRAVNQDLGQLREKVRSLRQTLISDGRLPSVAAIRNRMELENSIRRDETHLAQFAKGIELFGELANHWRRCQASLQELPQDDATNADRAKLASWSQLIRSQLVQFGFRSFAPSHVTVSPDSYRPEHEGFDLQSSLGTSSGTTFQLQNSISASDLIRTIWAYLNGMLEMARSENTNRPGCILFDEPRQQSTRDVSFAELLKRASEAGTYRQQVVFFTSENLGRLRSHLQTLPHSLAPIDGRVLKRLAQ